MSYGIRRRETPPFSISSDTSASNRAGEGALRCEPGETEQRRARGAGVLGRGASGGTGTGRTRGVGGVGGGAARACGAGGYATIGGLVRIRVRLVRATEVRLGASGTNSSVPDPVACYRPPMIQAAHHRFSFEDYVRLEEESGIKHEFLAGGIFAMAGGTPEHAAVTATVTRLLGNALLGRPCRVYSPDLRVRVQATGLGTYADVTVVCGSLELDPEDPKRHTALNPKVLVEVLSPSTEDYDRGDKLGHYKQIPTLEEVLLVAHELREVELVRREPDGSWSRQIARDGETLRLRSLDCELSVTDIYRDPLVSS